jgi:hypothetical protein
MRIKLVGLDRNNVAAKRWRRAFDDSTPYGKEI